MFHPTFPLIKTAQGTTMGGTWSLRQASNAPDGAALVQAACDIVEAEMSAWRPQSALSRLNLAPLGQWIDLPPDMDFVLGAGLALMRKLPGAFTLLGGGETARLGFQPGPHRPVGRDPAMIGHEPGRACRLADVSLDLNAIAKGHAADLAARLLLDEGITDFLIEIAGDIRAMGQRPDGLPWTAAVELPLVDRIVPARLLPLFSCGMASSGGYRRAMGFDSHLLHPERGPLPAHDSGVVTVLAPTALEADGWATALSVTGPEAGMALATAHDLPALWILPDPQGGGFIESGSPAMAGLLGED